MQPVCIAGAAMCIVHGGWHCVSRIHFPFLLNNTHTHIEFLTKQDKNLKCFLVWPLPLAHLLALSRLSRAGCYFHSLCISSMPEVFSRRLRSPMVLLLMAFACSHIFALSVCLCVCVCRGCLRSRHFYIVIKWFPITRVNDIHFEPVDEYVASLPPHPLPSSDNAIVCSMQYAVCYLLFFVFATEPANPCGCLFLFAIFFRVEYM